ncbi:MAG: hypothetical protein IT442_11760 [Phycisphaeraceae bacterium]|nr:hypothetical protein [Phycisphaeraceae bacterium]
MPRQNNDVQGWVEDYLHGLLDDEQSAFVRDQVESNPLWQVAMTQAQQRLEAMRELPAVEPSEKLIQTTLRRVDNRARWNRMTRRWSWRVTAGLLTAAAIVLGCVHAYFLTLSPTPYSLEVLGQSELLTDAPASLHVRFINQKTHQPIENADVRIALYEPQTGRQVDLAEFRTDSRGSGSPRFTMPDWKVGSYELRVTARPHGGVTESLTQSVRLIRSWQVMVSSDKPVYQPGQTILVRCQALRKPDLKPVGGQDILWTVADPKGNIIFKQHDVSSRFGIGSMQCPLADEIIEGPYTIACQLGDTKSNLTVEVKKYVLPKFKVDVELDKPFCQPGDLLRGQVGARYYFGKPLAGAAIDVQMQSTDFQEPVVQLPRIYADPDGKAKFELRIPTWLAGREQDSGNARVLITVTVTDTAGQQQSRTLDRAVVSEPMQIEVIPEDGELVQGIPNTLYLLVTYPDGTPAQADLDVTGIEQSVRTSDAGVTQVEFTPLSQTLALTIRATDKQGLTGLRRVTLTCGKGTADFITRVDRAVYDGGQSIRVTVLSGSAASRQPVYMDLIKDGQTMLTTSAEFKDGRAEQVIDLPPDLSGTLQLITYRYDADTGLPVRKSRVIYVRPARQIDVQTTLDRPEYRPGDQAQLSLQLRDAQGEPVPGAISLAAVDEAVFGVLEQRPGLEQTFFTLEHELLKPVYAIYPWSPDLTTSLPTTDLQSLEQALFARTAGTKVGGREELFQRLVEQKLISPDYVRTMDLDSFEEAWQRQLTNGTLPENVVEMLRKAEHSPYSLTGGTYAEKAAQTRMARHNGLEAMSVAWALYVFVAIIAGIACLLTYLHTTTGRTILNFVLIMLAIFLLVSLLLPSLGTARRQARRSEASTRARGIGQALTLLSEQAVPTAESPPADQPVRVRQWFPETLLWKPQIITDDQGRANLSIDLADSITTWRLSAGAVTADGQLGGTQTPIRVFQPFFVDLNLPVALTRGDEVAVPVVVYNYVDEPQTVRLELQSDGWFTLLDQPVQQIQLAAHEVRATSYRIQAAKVGRHELQVLARGQGGDADAIRRSVEVNPDGRLVEQTFNGSLAQPVTFSLDLPANAIEGSGKLLVKIYPTTFSQVVEGLEGVFQRPYGCFEQTSSTTYPNVLALDYLRRTGKSVPAVEATAQQYIHLGYQRLLSFEIPGGGFDWFGRPPANRTLTAYGLMEFVDMARVHDVDPRLIERTRQWLMQQRDADGSWTPDDHRMHGDPSSQSQARLSTTAYIAWALFGDDDRGNPEGAATHDYLLRHRPASIDDPYTLALVCNALYALWPDAHDVDPYLEKLASLRQTSRDGKLVWWTQSPGRRTTFYGAGISGDVETTATACLALMRRPQNAVTVRGALTWLIQQRSSTGAWPSTQATVLALKAMLAASGTPLGGDQERLISVALDGQVIERRYISEDQSDVLQQIDLSGRVSPGQHRLDITESTGGSSYQVVHRYHVPEAMAAKPQEPLEIAVRYDRREMQVGQTLAATATVTNRTADVASMVILDLPIPAGFELRAEDFDALVKAGSIAKYQLTPRSVIVYLRQLTPDQPLELRYRLEPTMPVKLTVPGAEAYEYYDPDQRGSAPAMDLEVTPPT